LNGKKLTFELVTSKMTSKFYWF